MEKELVAARDSYEAKARENCELVQKVEVHWAGD
jgi:hypothetical protein